MISPDALAFLRDLIGLVKLDADDPNLVVRAAQVAAVRDELDNALANIAAEPQPSEGTE